MELQANVILKLSAVAPSRLPFLNATTLGAKHYFNFTLPIDMLAKTRLVRLGVLFASFVFKCDASRSAETVVKQHQPLTSWQSQVTTPRARGYG